MLFLLHICTLLLFYRLLCLPRLAFCYAKSRRSFCFFATLACAASKPKAGRSPCEAIKQKQGKRSTAAEQNALHFCAAATLLAFFASYLVFSI
jgi:hypothetical protein